MTDRPAHELGALEAARAIADGRLTSEDLVGHLVARIARLDPQLHTIIAVHPEALAAARAADARRAGGAALGPLDGVPVIVKDNIEAVGLPGTAGSLAMAGAPAMRDAALVARLRAAGLVVLAAANLSEWANFRGRHSTSGWSGVGGLTQNPWQRGRSAGGSSSGSGAALAAGFAPLAVGTETDGSITCPAALCGVVGFKPTVGTVPTEGVAPISASQDSPGPMARSVADVAALLDVLSDRPVAPLAAADERPRRYVLGAPSAWRTGDPATDALVDEAIDRARAAGIVVVPVEVPAADESVGADEVTVLVHEMADDLAAYLAGRPGRGPKRIADIVGFNVEHGDRELAHFGQEYLELAAASGGRDADGYESARARNLAWARDEVLVPAFAHGVDALVAPAYGPAWASRLDGGDAFAGGAVTTPAAIAGWPILTLPVGLVDGLPIAVSLVGPEHGDGTVLAIGAALERAIGWSGRPDLG